MKVRKPNLDFSATPPHWAANPEFAQSLNASSLWFPFLERFLNRVMAKASAELKGEPAEVERLKADIRTFIRQEANHYTLHGAFNGILAAHGYDVARFERHFEAEFEKLFSTRSLAFLCAYCEGFETMGPPAALAWLDEMEDLLAGARPEVVALWKWHLMEEYEHRNVCHDVFHAVHGGYFMRIYGFFFQLRQLTGFSNMVRRHLLERDRAGMTKDELRASYRRERAASRRMSRLLLPRLLKALSPFYSPRKAKEPRMFRSYMARVESDLD
ncbi:MAG: metal-dependent hydrolase [Gammaproteobacteria bacterium]